VTIRVTTFDCHWKGIESWIRMKTNFCSGYKVPSALPKFTQVLLNMQAALYSPSTTTTLVQGVWF